MNKNYFHGLFALLMLFVALILILCWNFRISTDDYFYVSEVERVGVINIITSTYLKWSGRFAASAVMNFIFKILQGHLTLFFLIPLFTFIVLFVGIYRTIHAILFHYQIKVSLLYKWVLSLSFLSHLFFFSVDIGETWFWCSSIGCYLFSIVAFIWGVYFILQPGAGLLIYLAIFCCFLFIGGGTEIYSPIFLLILGGILLYYFQQFRSGSYQGKHPTFRQFMQNRTQRKLFVAFVSLGIGFVILLAAPGNYMRDQLFPQHRFFFSFFVTAKSFVKFFLLHIPLHLYIILAFGLVFLFAGVEFREKKSMSLKLEFLPFFKRITWLLLFLLAMFFYMVAYVMSETGPARIWFLASFLFSAYCCSISFYAGYCGLLPIKPLRILKFLSLFTIGVFLAYTLVQQTIITGHYAAKYDERAEQLIKWKAEQKKDTLLSIPALPKPGMLYPAEISTDSNHFTNQHLRMMYKLNYQVVKN